MTTLLWYYSQLLKSENYYSVNSHTRETMMEIRSQMSESEKLRVVLVLHGDD